jgi:hypothetical protein
MSALHMDIYMSTLVVSVLIHKNNNLTRSNRGQTRLTEGVKDLIDEVVHFTYIVVMDDNVFLIWDRKLDYYAAVVGYFTLFFGGMALIGWWFRTSDFVRDIKESIEDGNYKRLFFKLF